MAVKRIYNRFGVPVAVHEAAAAVMPPLSHLECTSCGHRQEIGDVAGNLRDGWPKCCGYTMRLYTMREMTDRRHR